jgi:hypothetical protein
MVEESTQQSRNFGVNIRKLLVTLTNLVAKINDSERVHQLTLTYYNYIFLSSRLYSNHTVNFRYLLHGETSTVSLPFHVQVFLLSFVVSISRVKYQNLNKNIRETVVIN